MKFFNSIVDFFYTDSEYKLKVKKNYTSNESLNIDLELAKNSKDAEGFSKGMEKSTDKSLEYIFDEKALNNESGEIISPVEIIKNEDFGFFAVLDIGSGSYLNLGRTNDIPWFGLKNTYRLDYSAKGKYDVDIKSYIVGFVKDDDGIFKADILENRKNIEIKTDKALVYFEISVLGEKNTPGDDDKEYNPEFNKDGIIINLYKSEGYHDEVLVDSGKLDISVIDFDYSMVEKSFFLDLWQHPSSWARANNLEYFSDEHFKVIEKYLSGMAKLGQNVIDLVISDFPWAGQKCYSVYENPSRLYEYNIVGVSRREGKLAVDFSNMDRYIDLCMSLGIDEEINLFGMIGLWDRVDFGSPLDDYDDPVRIRVYDEDKGIFTYIRNKSELGEYFKLVIDHLDDKGLLDITKVIGDEPSSVEIFSRYSRFIDESCGRNLSYKYALHSSPFFDEYEGSLSSFSVNTLQLGDFCDGENYVEKLEKNSYDMAWYACWFPEKFNTFIKSPLIESRYIGLYTYVWKMKGMLRWAYGLFVEDEHDVRYKPERWPAGDMYFVYPDKNGGFRHSLREMNMKYSIQDFNIFRGLGKENTNFYNELRSLLDIDMKIKTSDGNIVLSDYPNIDKYIEVRNLVVKQCIK